jgi:hypothetical protein
MRDQVEADAIEQRTEVAVQQEHDRRDGQDPSRGSSCRLEHREDQHRAEHEIDRRRRRRAQDEPLDVHEGPDERDDRQRNPREIEQCRAGPIGPAGIARISCHREFEKRQTQRDQQEREAVRVRVDDRDHPVERVRRQQEREGIGEAPPTPSEVEGKRAHYSVQT